MNEVHPHLRNDRQPVIPTCSPSDQGIRASDFTPRKGTRPMLEAGLEAFEPGFLLSREQPEQQMRDAINP